MKLRRSLPPLRGPLDMTALIDVVLLLIIFFILSSSFVLQPGIHVTPPRGLSDSGVLDSQFVLNITAQNPPMIFLNDQLIAEDRLGPEFRRIARSKNEPTLVLRADREVSHGTVTRIMSLALEEGLSVVVATQPEGGGAAVTLHELADEILPAERRWLGLIILCSLFLHLACFFVFRVERPPLSSLGLRPRQVTLMGAGDGLDGTNSLSWLYWRDPSAIALPRTPLPPPGLGLGTELPEGPAELPAMAFGGQEVSRNLPGSLDTRVRPSIATTGNRPVPVPVEVPPALGETTYRLSEPLHVRGIAQAGELPRPATGVALKSTVLRVAVNGLGLVESLVVEDSSGDSSVDEQAVRSVRRWRFTPDPAQASDQPLWGRITVFWYLDEKPPGGTP